MSSNIIDEKRLFFKQFQQISNSAIDVDNHSNNPNTPPPPIAQPIESNLIWQWITAYGGVK